MKGSHSHAYKGIIMSLSRGWLVRLRSLALSTIRRQTRSRRSSTQVERMYRLNTQSARKVRFYHGVRKKTTLTVGPSAKFDVLVLPIHDDARGCLGIVRPRPVVILFCPALIPAIFLRTSRLLLGSCRASRGLLALRGSNIAPAVTHDRPELLHLRARHDFIARTAEHEYGRRRRELRCLSKELPHQPKIEFFR